MSRESLLVVNLNHLMNKKLRVNKELYSIQIIIKLKTDQNPPNN